MGNDKLDKEVRRLLAWVAIAIVLIVVGTQLNQFVMRMNGNRMPVDTALIPNVQVKGRPIEDRWVVLTGATKFAFLADVIHASFMMLSIGDLLIVLGYLMYSYRLLVWAFRNELKGRA